MSQYKVVMDRVPSNSIVDLVDGSIPVGVVHSNDAWNLVSLVPLSSPKMGIGDAELSSIPGKEGEETEKEGTKNEVPPKSD